MKKVIEKVIEFFLNLLKQKTDESSKRFTGIIGFFSTMLFSFGYIIALNYQSQIVDKILILKDIPENILTLLITFIYVSAALLGLGILDKLTKK